jgi:hypothetical protein
MNHHRPAATLNPDDLLTRSMTPDGHRLNARREVDSITERADSARTVCMLEECDRVGIGVL